MEGADEDRLDSQLFGPVRACRHAWRPRSSVLLNADVAVSKTLVVGDWSRPLPTVRSSGIIGWARVGALPGVTGLATGEPVRALASSLGLPISSAGYAFTPSRADDKEDAGNGVEKAEEEEAADEEAAAAADAAGVKIEGDAGSLGAA